MPLCRRSSKDEINWKGQREKEIFGKLSYLGPESRWINGDIDFVVGGILVQVKALVIYWKGPDARIWKSWALALSPT